MNESEQGGELRDDAINEIRELMERFEQRLTLDNIRLVERYIKFELHLFVYFSIRGVCKQFVTCFQRAHHRICSKEDMHGGWDMDRVVRDGLLCLPNDLLQVSTCNGSEINTPEG